MTSWTRQARTWKLGHHFELWAVGMQTPEPRHEAEQMQENKHTHTHHACTYTTPWVFDLKPDLRFYQRSFKGCVSGQMKWSSVKCFALRKQSLMWNRCRAWRGRMWNPDYIKSCSLLPARLIVQGPPCMARGRDPSCCFVNIWTKLFQTRVSEAGSRSRVGEITNCLIPESLQLQLL